MTASTRIALSLLIAAAPLTAQRAADARTQDLRDRRATKLAEPFLEQGEWLTDFAAAKARAADTDRPILAYFTRSFAPCAPCKQLEKSVFENEAFQTWAKDRVVLFCHVTSHLPDEPEPLLLREKGGQAFPYVAVLDADGMAVGRADSNTIGGVRSAVEEQASTFAKLQRQAADAADDNALQDRLTVRTIELDRWSDFGQAHAAVAALARPEAEKQRLTSLLAEQEFNLILGTVHDRSQAAEGGSRAVPMFRAGRDVTGSLASYYWGMLGAHAMTSRDGALLGQLVDRMGELQDPGVKRLLPRFEQAARALGGQ